MKLQLNKKKLNITEVTSFWNRFKTLKFDLKPLKEVILFSNKKYLSTYLFCQKVDVVMTDKNNIILYIYMNLKSEKIIHYKRKVYNVYILPSKSCSNLKIGDKLHIIDNSNKKSD